MLLLMVHLEHMDDESQAVLCGKVEMEGAYISFMDACTAAEL